MTLSHFGMTVSMGRKGDCYDSAPMESVWGMLQAKLVHHRSYDRQEQARREISECIEIFYNRQRRHSRLGNRSSATCPSVGPSAACRVRRQLMASTIDNRGHL